MSHLIEVCRFLPNFLDKGEWQPATPAEELVLRTLARARGTYTAIIELVETERTLPAAMLGRSLFEDMVVTHWLVLHKEHPDWLIERFERHCDAMRLYDATVREQVNWMPSGDDISDLAGREENCAPSSVSTPRRIGGAETDTASVSVCPGLSRPWPTKRNFSRA
jgi:hypothetical protein